MGQPLTKEDVQRQAKVSVHGQDVTLNYYEAARPPRSAPACRW